MRRYIDEYLEPPEREWLTPNFEDIKNKVFEYHKNGLNPEEIVKKLQEDLYIFTDEEETKWETEVVYRILEGQSIKNRFTSITFN
jgi:hypothetical protein